MEKNYIHSNRTEVQIDVDALNYMVTIDPIVISGGAGNNNAETMGVTEERVKELIAEGAEAHVDLTNYYKKTETYSQTEANNIFETKTAFDASYNSIIEKINNIIIDTSLPYATTEKYGLVKIGSAIDVSNGVISVDPGTGITIKDNKLSVNDNIENISKYWTYVNDSSIGDVLYVKGTNDTSVFEIDLDTSAVKVWVEGEYMDITELLAQIAHETY